MCPKGSPLDSMARKRIAKIGRDIFERTIPASFTHAREDALGHDGQASRYTLRWMACRAQQTGRLGGDDLSHLITYP
jgi:hypothetical protein